MTDVVTHTSHRPPHSHCGARPLVQGSGFTLLEMLIVIAVIAVLVAIAIPVFSSQLERAREATCQSNRKALEELVKADCMSQGTLDYQVVFDDDYTNNESNKATYICPGNGTFSIDADSGEILCSVHRADTTGLSARVGRRRSQCGLGGCAENAGHHCRHEPAHRFHFGIRPGEADRKCAEGERCFA